jgi:hypothetical protein
MGGGLLDVAQRHPGVKRGSDKYVPKGVRGDGFGDPGAAGDLANEPPRAVPVQPRSVGGQEHRPVGALADGQVDGPGSARRQRNRDDLAALAGDGQRASTALATRYRTEDGYPGRSQCRQSGEANR